MPRQHQLGATQNVTTGIFIQIGLIVICDDWRFLQHCSYIRIDDYVGIEWFLEH